MFARRLLSLCLCLIILPTWCMAGSLLDSLALHPTTEPITDGSKERVLLPSGIEVWIHRRAPASLEAASLQPTSELAPHSLSPRLYVLHFIMNASRAEREVPGSTIMPLFPPELDIEVWSVNYAGYGGSPGTASLQSFASTATEAYDTMLTKGATAETLVLSGSSIGTMAALYLATVRPSKLVILRNPLPLREFIIARYGQWGYDMVAADMPEQLHSIENASKVTSPGLILTSERDTMIAPAMQKLIVDRYAGEHRQIILEGIGHNDGVPASAFTAIREALAAALTTP